MTKKLKLNIKNTQIAKALDLGSLKDKLEKKKAGSEPTLQKTGTEEPTLKTAAPKKAETKIDTPIKEASKSSIKIDEVEQDKEVNLEEAPRIKARKTSAFSHEVKPKEESEAVVEAVEESHETPEEIVKVPVEAKSEEVLPVKEEPEEIKAKVEPSLSFRTVHKHYEKPTPPQPRPAIQKLGPTGRHVKDLLPPPRPKRPPQSEERPRPSAKGPGAPSAPAVPSQKGDSKKNEKSRFKEFQDLKPTKKSQQMRPYEARDRRSGSRDDESWRKRRSRKSMNQADEISPDLPKELKIRLPLTLKDLASEMKLKSSQLISFLFKQGVAMTINDFFEDETTIQLLGHEFGCDIQIDTTEEERIQVTGKSIKEEVLETSKDQLKTRPPVVTFMGHVDHGKTSLIDAIRETNRTASEAGAITQHIGAFRCHTAVGDIAILDTPGHEAFSAMRARGADVTDIVVLVVAGDEGIRQQTLEAIQHAKAAGVTIVVAINKCDKPGFDADNVYRQLADHELLPEAWGGQTITINCSAKTKVGIKELLEMLALQAEVLELKANPNARARGSVLESEMHKGRGAVATILVQNGTLKLGDAIVFQQHWGRVKTMHDEFGRSLKEADPSTPLELTGLSGIPTAGEEFIVVQNEKEARNIAEVRSLEVRHKTLGKQASMESLLQQAAGEDKKLLKILLRADVQGSLEALKTALEKITSDKARLEIIFTGIGEVSESDIQLAAASNAMILGFHTSIEAHAEELVKQHQMKVLLHNIIYHAIDEVKAIMKGLLDKTVEEKNVGEAEVLAIFKSSQLGIIAGCMVQDGVIKRNQRIRQLRNGEIIWKGTIHSIKREKEDVKEVQKGFECGIVLAGNREIQAGDILQSYELVYHEQEL